MKIGIFDSGRGGLSVANAVEKHFPTCDVIFETDVEHLPYGSKSPEELMTLVEPILTHMVAGGCSVIVIACNTVTTTLIDQLRKVIKVPLIGIEPMVKPATELTRSGTIAVCATPTTLASERYNDLKNKFAGRTEIIEPDCSDWALMIEESVIDKKKIRAEIDSTLERGADVIVLACTHYHWIEDLITDMVDGKAVVLQPELATIAQLKRVLEQLP